MLLRSALFLLLCTAAQAEDSALWRALHGPLLSATRAGSRLVVAGDRGSVLLSDDQGAHWRLAQTNEAVLLTQVIFPTPADGFAVGQDATILHSEDGGAHWVRQFSTPGADRALFSASVLGPNHVIATGAYALALETQDGATWSAVKLPDSDEDYHLNCVTARGGDVVITGEAGHGFVRHAGQWTAHNLPYQGSQFGCLTLPSGDVYSFGLRGSLFVWKAGTQDWQRIETGERRSIFGGTVLDDGRIALVGGNGLLMLLRPATGQCEILPNPTSATLSASVQADDGRLVVVGSDGVHLVDLRQRTGAGLGLTQ